MKDAGTALMGIGSASGDNRAAEAATQAIASPLLETSISGARGILLNITGGKDLSLYEVNEAAQAIAEAAHDEANIIFGAVVDERLEGRMTVTVIATGFDGQARVQEPPRGEESEPRAASRAAGADLRAAAALRRRPRRAVVRAPARGVAAPHDGHRHGSGAASRDRCLGLAAARVRPRRLPRTLRPARHADPARGDRPLGGQRLASHRRVRRCAWPTAASSTSRRRRSSSCSSPRCSR